MAVALVVAVTLAASAHRRDEYLQAARIGVEPARVEVQLDLTPGIAVADAFSAAVDRDRDGRISDGEARAYAEVVLGAVTLAIDGRALRPQLMDAQAPPLDAVARGEGALRVRFAADLPPLTAGVHRLIYRNTHRPDGSVYLANALVPRSDRVAISSQDRDVDQRELTITYELQADRQSGRLLLPAAGIGVMCVGIAVWVRRAPRTR